MNFPRQQRSRNANSSEGAYQGVGSAGRMCQFPAAMLLSGPHRGQIDLYGRLLLRGFSGPVGLDDLGRQ